MHLRIVWRALLTRYAEADPARSVAQSVRIITPTVPGAALAVLTCVDGTYVDVLILVSSSSTSAMTSSSRMVCSG